MLERAPSIDSRIEEAIDLLREVGRRGDQRLGDAESAALSLLYGHYAARALRAARAASEAPADAPDVVHEVFMNLPKLLLRYVPGDFGAWLGLIVRRAARSLSRRRWREQPFAGDSESATSTDSTEHTAEWLAHPNAGGVDLVAAVKGLPERYRGVIVLRAFDGCSHRDIGRRLGISATASEVRLCRGIKRLREIMMPSAGAHGARAVSTAG